MSEKSPLEVELAEKGAGTGATSTAWLFSIGMDDKPSMGRLLCCTQITTSRVKSDGGGLVRNGK